MAADLMKLLVVDAFTDRPFAGNPAAVCLLAEERDAHWMQSVGLGPYWSEQLGKTEMTAFQASARGGVVRVRVAGDRVLLGGQAVTVVRGEFDAGAGNG